MQRHWVDLLGDDLRERMHTLSEAVATAVAGDRPMGWTPQRREDEVQSFLELDEQGRRALFATMSPEEYTKYTKRMMGMVGTRYGAAAQVLQPMLEGGQLDALSDDATQGHMGDGTAGMALARDEITKLLGTDPFWR